MDEVVIMVMEEVEATNEVVGKEGDEISNLHQLRKEGNHLRGVVVKEEEKVTNMANPKLNATPLTSLVTTHRNVDPRKLRRRSNLYSTRKTSWRNRCF